jgi:putative transposase
VAVSRLYGGMRGCERRDAALPRLKLKAMTLFRTKYRIESARKPYWDYSSPGWYFVTICTKDRKTHFGRVMDGSMNLSDIGAYATACWQEIPAHHSRTNIDEFIVMPNHVHGIIVIVGPERLPELRKRGETRGVPELSSVHPKTGSLGAVVGSFKAAVSYWCRTQEVEFGWQARFHDRIIRGRNSLKAVREYIRENPANWQRDELFVT